jgi:hypothetical protein
MLKIKTSQAYFLKLASLAAVLFVISFSVAAIVFKNSPKQENGVEIDQSNLSGDETYLATLDAIERMQKSAPCDALAHTMLVHATNTSLPQRTREVSVYRVMKKATRYCM